MGGDNSSSTIEATIVQHAARSAWLLARTDNVGHFGCGEISLWGCRDI